MAQAKLEQARLHIKAKRYADARRILEGMATHPTAAKWLARLNEIAPADSIEDPFAPQQSRGVSLGLGIVSVLTGVIGVLILLGLALVFVQMQQGRYYGNYTELLPWALAVLVLLPLAYGTRKMRRS